MRRCNTIACALGAYLFRNSQVLVCSFERAEVGLFRLSSDASHIRHSYTHTDIAYCVAREFRVHILYIITNQLCLKTLADRSRIDQNSSKYTYIGIGILRCLCCVCVCVSLSYCRLYASMP